MSFGKLGLCALFLCTTACKSEKKTAPDENASPIDSRVGVDTSLADQASKTQDAAAIGSYSVSSTCTDSFSLKLTTGSTTKLISLSSFPGCEALAKALDQQSLPVGSSKETLEGGPTISARCEQGVLDVKRNYPETNTIATSTVTGLDQQVCIELRDRINAQKL